MRHHSILTGGDFSSSREGKPRRNSERSALHAAQRRPLRGGAGGGGGRARARLFVPPDARMAPAGVAGHESDAGAAHFDAGGDTAEHRQQAADAVRVAPGALRDAAVSDRGDDVERLLAAGARPDDPDGAPGTALLTAVAAGAPRATRALLAAGASVEVLCPVTRGNAAHVAARSPDPECAARLIEACAASEAYAKRGGLGEREARVFSLDALDRDGRGGGRRRRRLPSGMLRLSPRPH